MQSANPERPLPVRHRSEPFRSRRISSPSFEHGCFAEFEAPLNGSQRRWRGQVLDISVRGVGAALQGFHQKDRPLLSRGMTIDGLVLDYFGTSLYQGDAVVAHCSATAKGLRLGLSLVSDCIDLSALHRQAFRLAFRRRWQRLLGTLSNRSTLPTSANASHVGVSREFAAWVDHYEFIFRELRAFLDAEEQQSRQEDLVTHGQNMQEMLAVASQDVTQEVRRFVEDLGDRVAVLPPHTHDAHKIYVRSQLRQHLLEGPFYHRAITKPLGYPGDYEMLNILYRSEPAGDNLFARVLSVSAKSEFVSRAVTNRLNYLGNIMVEHIERTSRGRCRIASIGCGAAREVWELLTKRPELGSRLDMTLVDREPRALQYCERTLVPLARATGAQFRFIGDPIQQIVKSEHLGSCFGELDLMYSAGLFCYLDDAAFMDLVGALRRALAPAGRLVVGNMGAANPTRHFMDFVLDWRLNHRTPDDLLRLAEPLARAGDRVDVQAEPLGINLFLHVTRTDSA
jgi:extracellular factor (EF) 3-hydroxypalmitic acid methyl ester biosynthesis protein